jgi:DNA polymerase-1
MAGEEREIDNEDNIRVLLVGEAPGDTEDKKGLPFVGSSGKILTKALHILAEDEGLDLATVGITNSVRCRPENNKNPGVKAKRECLKYLEAEVQQLSPEVIVCLGGQALSALTNGEITAVGPSRLKVLEAFGLPMMVTFHPAAMLYDKTKVQDFLDDLHAILVKEVWHEDSQVEENVNVRLISQPAHWELLKLRLIDQPHLGLDIETDGFTPHVLTIALAIPGGTAYVLPVHHRESTLDGAEVKEWVVKYLLMDSERTITGQNVKYDISMLMRSTGRGSIPAQCRTEDSMIFHYMLNEHSTSRNLDYLSRAYSGLGGYKEEVNHGSLASERLSNLAAYNGRDAALPLRINDRLRRILDSQGYRSLPMERFYSRLTVFAATMEAAGIRVDPRRLEAVKASLSTDIARLQSECQDMAPDINLDSPKQLSNYIYEELGLKVPDVKDAITPSGQKSTREDVLTHLTHPFVDKLLEFRGTAKLLRTYVGGIESNLWPNNFVHPNFFIAKTDYGGTVTGRLSCKKPAMQTIPRGSEIRSVFVPRNDSGLLLEFDASQAELRVAASFSGDETLTNIFNSGIDPHQATADLCGVDRQLGKTINFASIYGVSEWGLREQAGLDPMLAKRVVKTLKREWAGLYSYFDRVKKQAIQDGEVSTEYGRWRRVPGAVLHTPRGRALLREAANFTIQAPASDFVQTFGHHLSLALSGLAVPIMSNHDGLLFDVFDKDKTQDVVDCILTEMDNFASIIHDVFEVDLKVPFEWDMKVGENLFEMEELPNAS